MDLRILRLDLRPRRGRSGWRNSRRYRLRGHPRGLVLPGLRGSQDRFRALRGLNSRGPCARPGCWHVARFHFVPHTGTNWALGASRPQPGADACRSCPYGQLSCPPAETRAGTGPWGRHSTREHLQLPLRCPCFTPVGRIAGARTGIPTHEACESASEVRVGRISGAGDGKPTH